MVRVSVTQDDIDKGVPHVAYACPVARAVGRAMGGDGFVLVESERIECTLQHKGFETHSWETPEVVQKFIERFDEEGGHERVSPFEFDLPG